MPHASLPTHTNRAPFCSTTTLRAVAHALLCAYRRALVCIVAQQSPPTPCHLSGFQEIKKHLDDKWRPHWHCIIGKNFGCYATHEAKKCVYFYHNDVAVMLFKT